MAVVESGLGLKTNLVLPPANEGDGDGGVGGVGDNGDGGDKWSDGNPGVRPGRCLVSTVGVTGDRVLFVSRFLLTTGKLGRTELLN